MWCPPRVRSVPKVLELDVRGMDQAGFAEFETALTDNLVLFVRDQDLDPEELRSFAKRFGKPVSYPTSVPMPGYPEVTEFRSELDTVYNFGGSWHTDSMFLERPPSSRFSIAWSVTLEGAIMVAVAHLKADIPLPPAPILRFTI